MSDSSSAYGLSPYLLDNFEPSRTRSSKPGIGPGEPISFPLSKGETPDDVWTFLPDWSYELQAGFLRCSAIGQFGGVRITRPFSTANANLTVAFALRFEGFSNARGDAFTIYLPFGVYLLWKLDGTGLESQASYHSTADGRMLGQSKVSWRDSSKWHRFVMTLHGTDLMIWESDEDSSAEDPHFRFSVPPPESKVQIGWSFAHGFHDGHLGIDIRDVQVLVGLDRTARLRSDKSQSTLAAFPSVRSQVESLAAPLKAIYQLGEVQSLTQNLRNLHIGPSALFWGKSIDSKLKTQARDVWNHPSVQSLVNRNLQAIAGSPQSGGPSFYIGVGFSLDFFLSVGASLGFILSAGTKYLVITSHVGAVTNIGALFGIDFAAYPSLHPRTLLCWGAYLQAGGGQIVEGAVGLSGTRFPFHIHSEHGHRAWDNCGPSFFLGIGAGLLPAELSAAGTYTFWLATL